MNCGQGLHGAGTCGYAWTTVTTININSLTSLGQSNANHNNGNGAIICFNCHTNIVANNVNGDETNVAELSTVTITNRIHLFSMDLYSSVSQGGDDWIQTDYHLQTMQAAAIIGELLEMIDKKVVRSIRDMYYKYESLLQDATAAGSFLRTLSNRMGLALAHINIMPDIGKGKIHSVIYNNKHYIKF